MFTRYLPVSWKNHRNFNNGSGCFFKKITRYLSLAIQRAFRPCTTEGAQIYFQRSSEPKTYKLSWGNPLLCLRSIFKAKKFCPWVSLGFSCNSEISHRQIIAKQIFGDISREQSENFGEFPLYYFAQYCSWCLVQPLYPWTKWIVFKFTCYDHFSRLMLKNTCLIKLW